MSTSNGEVGGHPTRETEHRETPATPVWDAAIARRVTAFGTLAMIGGATLTAGAVAVDLGAFAGRPVLESLGYALSAGAGFGLLFLPFGLRASRVGGEDGLANVGTGALAIGISLVSLVDVPSVFDPTNLAAGGTLGPVGLVLLSVGFLAWFAVIRRSGILRGWRRYVFLVAGLWFLLTFPTVQIPLFVIPNGRPSFVLLAGILGVLQLLMGAIIREQVGTSPDPRPGLTDMSRPSRSGRR